MQPAFDPKELHDPLLRYTVEEWKALEAKTRHRLDFHLGQVIDVTAMSGETRYHTLVCSNVHGLCFQSLREADSKCISYTSELKIELDPKGRYVYPDATISCNSTDGLLTGSIVDPVVVFEVLSESSEGYDKGGKRRLYKKVPSLREYVLIDSRQRQVEVRSRGHGEQDIWRTDFYEGKENSFTLESVGITLRLEDLYARCTFYGDDPGPQPPLLVAEETQV